MKKYNIIYADPTPEELRECIKQGYCWWCGKSGWRRLAQHTSMAHGIYADDIRNLAILIKHTPTCIREESEIMSERTLQLLKEGKRKLPDWRLGNLVKHKYSEAGLAHQREIARHMRGFLTEDSAKKTGLKLRKPHPCPICGAIVPNSQRVCCSLECATIRMKVGFNNLQHNTGKAAAITRVRLAKENPEYKLKMSQVEQHQKHKKPHACSICGRIILKSRPRKYCSPECARNPFQLPIEEIKKMYLGGISSVELSKIYNCCDHTIRRHLRESGVKIRTAGATK